MERAKGIEPSYAAWEAAVLPLNYARSIPADIGKYADPQATNFAPTLTAQPSHQGGGMVGDRFLQPAAGRHPQGSETPAIGDRHLNRDLGPAGPPGRPTTRTRLRCAFRPERGGPRAP